MRFIPSALRRPSGVAATLLLAVISTTLGFAVAAQEPSSSANASSANTSSSANPSVSAPASALRSEPESANPADPSPRVLRVVDAAPAEYTGPAPSHLEIHDTLALKVEGLTDLIGENAERCYDLRLYFDGGPVQNLKPERCLLQREEVWFQLWRIDRAGEQVWLDLLAEREGLAARVDVTLGLRDAEPLPTDIRGDSDRILRLVPPDILAAAVAVLIVAFFGFLWLDRRTGVLRDADPKADRATRRRAPYSLARVQVAWWFFLVLGSFLFISILVGDLANIPSSVLGLMALAAGTYMGSEIIDEGFESQTAETDTLDKPSPEESSPAPRPQPRSRGLLVDLLSGPSGQVTFYCFQIFVWTLVVGGFFVLGVVRNLAMPNIPLGLLGLMGISGGTYLGMKFPAEERRSQNE